MITKLIIFGLLCSTVIQAYPTSDTDSDDDDEDSPSAPLELDHEASPSSHLIADDEKKKTCDQKLAWFKNVTEKTQKYYDQYYAKLKGLRLNPENTSHIKVDHDKFKELVTESLDKYKKDKEKLFTIHDDTARLAFCQKEINWYKALDHNLTGIATNVKGNVLDLLDALGVPQHIRDTLDQTLSRIVNFLFIIDMTKNTFKDIRSLVNEMRTKTDNKVELEKVKEINEKGEVVDKATDVVADYDEKALDEPNEVDKEIEHDLIDLEDHHQVDEAKERAEERERQRELEAEEHEREIEHNGVEEHPFEPKPFYEVIPGRG